MSQLRIWWKIYSALMNISELFNGDIVSDFCLYYERTERMCLHSVRVLCTEHRGKFTPTTEYLN